MEMHIYIYLRTWLHVFGEAAVAFQLMLKCWSSLYITGINIALSNPIASVFPEQYLWLLFYKEIPFLKILVGDNIPGH